MIYVRLTQNARLQHKLSFIERTVQSLFFSSNDSMRLKCYDWNNEVKNKNEEEISCHWWSEKIETDCYHCEYNNDWYAEYKLLTDDCYHYDCYHCDWDEEEIDWEDEEEINWENEEDLWRDIILFIYLIILSTKCIFNYCSLNLMNLLIKFFNSSLSVHVFNLFWCINDH